MEDHDDFAFEPVPGLPERLPAGEAMLWQGSPDWLALAYSAFHVRKVAAWFGILIGWKAISALRAGTAAVDILSACAWLVLGGGLSIAILLALSKLYAHGTIYTLTSKRIVIRSGAALPVTLNLPFSQIDSAAVAAGPGGTGSIALKVLRPNRVAWLVLWPNARPWRFNSPQPMLRCLKDYAVVAPMLAGVLEADAGANLPESFRRPAQAGRTVAAATIAA